MFSLATLPFLALATSTIGVNAVNAHFQFYDHSPCVQGSYVMPEKQYQIQNPDVNTPWNKHLPICHSWKDSDPPFLSYSAHLEKDPRTLTMQDCPLVMFSEPNCDGEARMHGDMSAIAENCVAIDGTWGRSFLFDCKMKDNWQQHIPRGVEMPTLPREPKTTITTTITPIDLGPAPTKPTSPHVSPTAILPRDGKTTVVDGHTTTVPWVTEVVHKLNVPGAGQVIDTRFYGKTLTFDGHTTTIDSFNTFEWVASVLSAEERTTIRSNTKPTIVLPRNDKTILTTRVSPKAMVFHNDKTTITTTFNTMDLSPATTKPQSPGNDKTTLATLPRPTPALADNDEATTFTQVSPTAIPPRKVKPTITTTVEVEVIDLGPATTKGQSPHTSPPTPTLPRDDKPTTLPRPTPALPDFGDATMFTQDTPTAIRPRHNPFATAVELYPISWDPSRASPSPAGKGEGEDA